MTTAGPSSPGVGAPASSPAVDATSSGPAATRSGRRPAWYDALSVALVLAVFAVPLRALFRYQGPPMEEGFMLVFPERVLHGAVPNRDFLHLYGPGSLWVLAGWFKVFGVTLASERVFGMLQLLGIIFGVYILARPWGRRVAVSSGVIGVLISVTAVGLTALAWDGAVALGLIGLAVGLRARRRLMPEGVDEEASARPVRRLLLLSGLLAGLSLLFRPDLAIGVALAFGCVLWGLTRPRVLAFVTGLGVGLAPYLVQLVTAGPGHSLQGMLLDPVFRLRDGRSLPVPPSWDRFDGALQKVSVLRVPGWSLPAPATSHQVVFWFFLLPLTTVTIVGVGMWRVRAEPAAWRPRVLLAVGLFGLGLMPQALQRPDTTHLSWVSGVPLAFFPAALAELLAHVPSVPIRRWAGTVAAGVGVAMLLVFIPHFTFRTWLDLSNQTFERHVLGYPVRRNGRIFYLGSPQVAGAVRQLVADIPRLARPGDRLFVGTADLRKTPYSDAYLYHLMPELEPATYYIEMDPGMANRRGSGLDREVAAADWLVLSHVWDVWIEDNASQRFGPDGPNEVVRRQFCRVKDYGGFFELYRRCRRAT